MRREYPSLEPEREVVLRERNRVAFEDDPRRAELQRRFLDLNGTLVLLFLPDPHIAELLERGRYYPGARALMSLGEPSACHANAAMLFVQAKGAVRIASGYALSGDGLWRQHSWGVSVEDGRIVETTERRVRYFGFILNDAEIAWRLLTVKESGALWPDEAEEVREVLLKVFRLPAELLDPGDRGTTDRTGDGRP